MFIANEFLARVVIETAPRNKMSAASIADSSQEGTFHGYDNLDRSFALSSVTTTTAYPQDSGDGDQVRTLCFSHSFSFLVCRERNSQAYFGSITNFKLLVYNDHFSMQGKSLTREVVSSGLSCLGLTGNGTSVAYLHLTLQVSLLLLSLCKQHLKSEG